MSAPGPDRSLDDPLPRNPLPLLERWLAAAIEALGLYNGAAMTLATVDSRGRPAARMVIGRHFDARQGWFAFYTDRTSPKARELAAAPRAALVFYWEPLYRQVRVEGPVVLSPDAESDAYFASRPVGSQLAAWTSEQSTPIDSRGTLLRRYGATRERFGVEGDDEAAGSVPRPPTWGGYRVWIERLEFWVGRPDRLHDRALFERTLAPVEDGFEAGPWRATRLQP